MDMNAERPFACSAPGCTQRFPTEDHLMIHRHKHEMSLKLPSAKKDSVLSDQTPTPTRFLRSCEEVGLFRELDSQAAEHGPHLSVPQGSVDHDHMSGSSASQQAPPTKANSILTQQTTTNQQLGPGSGLLSCMLYLQAQQRQPQPASRPDSAQPDPALPDSAHPSAVSHTCTCSDLQVKSHGLPIGSRLIGSTHGSTGSSPQILHSEAKQKLKATLRHHSGCAPDGDSDAVGHMMPMTSPPQQQLPHAYQRPGHAHSQSPTHSHPQGGYNHPQRHFNQLRPPLPQTPPHAPAHPGTPSQVWAGVQAGVGRRRRGREEDSDGRREKFLERNRAAASRCRQKRKVWVCSLERKAEELSHTHLQLQNEVTQLKSEVTQLKQLLLAHRDCPITKRLRDTTVQTPGQQMALPRPALSPPLQQGAIESKLHL
ncbi:cyclic AMP-responsive element-binding protein 5-like isoform X2 [Conger conger]|uniref:cyclic AMP-responsive element-binding protein 5-like isoform X2 n=1 Tax=Conger conger TaxID=82655 RepID=UPI002A5A218D|nr:cyclic AMP-responsive element-binding protein 5-like isoform X2 [Conger conger]